MNKNLIQSELLRNIYYAKNKAIASCQVWRKGPKIFINSLPKSGTHLITSLLDATGEIKSAGRHLRTVDFDLSTAEQKFTLDTEGFLKQARKVRGKQYFSAHFPWDDGFDVAFQTCPMKVLNVVRDPRDMIVSRYHYVKDLKRHYLNEFLTNNYSNDEDRILALINGPSSSDLGVPQNFLSYRTVLERFEYWQSSSAVLTVRYEDIIGPRGGGSVELQVQTIKKLLDYVDVNVSESEIEGLIPKFLGVNTATMRSGTSGEWRSKLSDKAQEAVNYQLSDVISRMGYS